MRRLARVTAVVPRPHFPAGLLICLLVVCLTPRVARAQDEPAPGPRSTLDGVFTEEQARRGEALNQKVCGACHMPEWFTGTFMRSWSGATVGMLFDLISATMPEDRPGGLKRREYADVLAYIFELNGLPPGDEELSSRKEVLAEILIQGRE